MAMGLVLTDGRNETKIPHIEERFGPLGTAFSLSFRRGFRHQLLIQQY